MKGSEESRQSLLDEIMRKPKEWKDIIYSKIREHKKQSVTIMLALLIVLAGVGTGMYYAYLPDQASDLSKETETTKGKEETKDTKVPGEKKDTAKPAQTEETHKTEEERGEEGDGYRNRTNAKNTFFHKRKNTDPTEAVFPAKETRDFQTAVKGYVQTTIKRYAEAAVKGYTKAGSAEAAGKAGTYTQLDGTDKSGTSSGNRS